MRRPIDRTPPRHLLAVAASAAGVAPACIALGLLVEWVPVQPPPGVLAAGLTILIVAIVAAPLLAPLSLFALAAYWREAPASRARTLWTAAVLVLLAPTLGALAYAAAVWVATP